MESPTPSATLESLVSCGKSQKFEHRGNHQRHSEYRLPDQTPFSNLTMFARTGLHLTFVVICECEAHCYTDACPRSMRLDAVELSTSGIADSIFAVTVNFLERRIKSSWLSSCLGTTLEDISPLSIESLSTTTYSFGPERKENGEECDNIRRCTGGGLSNVISFVA